MKGAAEQIDDLIALVLLAQPKGASLVDQLNSAKALLDAGRNAAAREQLNAFIKLVQAQSGMQFSVSLANKLMAGAVRIMGVIDV